MTIDGQPMEDSFTSIILVNYNGWHFLQPCLKALQKTKGTAFEIIVVDNGSRDESVTLLAQQFPEVRVLAFQENLGFGRANQKAVEVARGNYIVFLNNDTVVEPEWLIHLLKPLQAHPEIVASAAVLLSMEFPEQYGARGGGMTLIGFGYDRDGGTRVEPLVGEGWRETLFPTGAAMLMRRDEFCACGGFDSAMFMYHEDVDLGWRLWLLGKRVVVCERARVAHYGGGTTQRTHGSRWRDTLGMRHNFRSLIKHYELGNLVRALLMIFRLWFERRDFEQIRSVLFWNFVHAPGTLRERWKIQRQRQRTDRDLFEAGLIDLTPFPPSWGIHFDPHRSSARILSHWNDWIPSRVLQPGYPSAENHLDTGWWGAEYLDGHWVRWSTGHGKAYLKCQPNQSGTLTAVLHLPSFPQMERHVRVTCNGSSRDVFVPAQAWVEVILPARTDDNGSLEIVLEAKEWAPCLVSNSMDARRLGCLVREYRFSFDKTSDVQKSALASVIIPTQNRWAILERVLSALMIQTWPDYEVIVVDDGSTDGTYEKLEAWARKTNPCWPLKLLRQEKNGPGWARNRALQAATGEVVIFIGDDIIPEPDFIQQHMEKHREIEEPCAVLGYTRWDGLHMRVTPFLDFVNHDGAQFGYGRLQEGEEAPLGCFYTSNLSISRELLGENPFHEAFTEVNWEDIELGYRLYKRGLRLIYHPAAQAHHYHPTTMRQFLERQRRVGEASHIILTLHPELLKLGWISNPEPSRSDWWIAGWKKELWLWLDNWRIPLPAFLYRLLLAQAYAEGRKMGENRPAISAPMPSELALS